MTWLTTAVPSAQENDAVANMRAGSQKYRVRPGGKEVRYTSFTRKTLGA